MTSSLVPFLWRAVTRLVPGLAVVGLVITSAFLAAACSSDGSVDTTAADESATAATIVVPTESAVATPSPIPAPTPTITPSATPQRKPDPVPPAPPVAETTSAEQQAFCTFMATRYFWEPGLEAEFLELMPADVPTSIVIPVRASEILGAPGLGDATVNSQAVMIMFTAFASDLGRFLNAECPGPNWVEIAVAHSGDPDFNKFADPLVPASQLNLCADLVALEGQLKIERGLASGPTGGDTMIAAQAFASAIEPDAPFEVLAFSHLFVTQVALSMNSVAFDLYIDVAFDSDDLVDSEAVSAYFDQVCPEVRDTRDWLTPSQGAGAIRRPESGEGLPAGWETVPAEDIRSSFGGDLRTLPVGELTPLLVRYPNFEVQGVEFTHIGSDWFTASVDPPQAQLTLQLIFAGEEFPVDISKFAFVGADGTLYRAIPEQSVIAPDFVALTFELDVIPEGLTDWQFGVLAE